MKRWQAKLYRPFIITGTLVAALAPNLAWAHDNLGGDELAVANWMLVGAIITVVMGVLMGVWAWRNGQFTNIESSKYSMLETSDDLDKIMAEIIEAERANAKATSTPAKAKS